MSEEVKPYKRFGQILPVPTALDVQTGGTHYKDMKIQPIEFIHANNLGYCEANIVKYITRWRNKNGIEDLEKVKHYVDLLIQLEKLDETVPNDEGRAYSMDGVGTKCDRNL